MQLFKTDWLQESYKMNEKIWIKKIITLYFHLMLFLDPRIDSIGLDIKVIYRYIGVDQNWSESYFSECLIPSISPLHIHYLEWGSSFLIVIITVLITVLVDRSLVSGINNTYSCLSICWSISPSVHLCISQSVCLCLLSPVIVNMLHPSSIR